MVLCWTTIQATISLHFLNSERLCSIKMLYKRSPFIMYLQRGHCWFILAHAKPSTCRDKTILEPPSAELWGQSSNNNRMCSKRNCRRRVLFVSFTSFLSSDKLRRTYLIYVLRLSYVMCGENSCLFVWVWIKPIYYANCFLNRKQHPKVWLDVLITRFSVI